VNPDLLLVSFDEHVALLEFEQTGTSTVDTVWYVVLAKVWS
jgi:hypothetical protein